MKTKIERIIVKDKHIINIKTSKISKARNRGKINIKTITKTHKTYTTIQSNTYKKTKTKYKKQHFKIINIIKHTYINEYIYIYIYIKQ